LHCPRLTNSGPGTPRWAPHSPILAAQPDSRAGARFGLAYFVFCKTLWKMLSPHVHQILCISSSYQDRSSATGTLRRVMPFLCELSPPRSGKERTCWRGLLARRRAYSPAWAECVSRLIGNFDTTALPGGWQVEFQRTREGGEPEWNTGSFATSRFPDATGGKERESRPAETQKPKQKPLLKEWLWKRVTGLPVVHPPQSLPRLDLQVTRRPCLC
jgi:hypothetical protein